MILPPLRHFRVDDSLSDRMTVWIDVAGRSVNVLFDEVFEELTLIIDAAELADRPDPTLADSPEPRNLPIVFRSAKAKGYIVGADLKRIAAIQSDAEIQAFLQHGQDALNRLEASYLPTIALIQGACLGGGLEFALACKMRLACDNPETILGMPETKIGLMPGWGGTQRLTECIGLRHGLELLLRGDSVHARQAYNMGLVDQVIAIDQMEMQLSNSLATLRHQHRDRSLGVTRHFADERLDWDELRKDYNLESRSARAILQAVELGRSLSREAGFQIERQEFFGLLQTGEAQACIRRFA